MGNWFAPLIIVSYMLGAFPLSYLAAKLSKGIDLRKYGTGQVGAGNLYRMTGSMKIGLAVAIFDVGKGALMVWIANVAGLSPAQQLLIGTAAVIGHNWSVFLRFSGGRGIGTTLGVLLIAPLLNSITLWGFISLLAIALIGVLLLRSTPLPVLGGIAAMPVASWLAADSPAVSLCYLLLLLIIIVKRVTAKASSESGSISKGKLLLNRLLFDRDIRDGRAWMYRKPEVEEEEEGEPDEMRHPS